MNISNECILVLIALMFVYFNYKINKLENNKENFDTTDPNTVAIANLNNLASSILNSNTLNIPTNTTINGDLNIGRGGDTRATPDSLFTTKPYPGGNILNVDTIYCNKIVLGGNILTDSYGLNINYSDKDCGGGIIINGATGNTAGMRANVANMKNLYEGTKRALYQVGLFNYKDWTSPDAQNNFNSLHITSGGTLKGVNGNYIQVTNQGASPAGIGK
jgi:hypothetical protein